ncbi:MAG: DUF6789 family protein [Haloferacaceae archaeon]
MSGETTEAEPVPVEGTVSEALETIITGRVVLTAMTGGLAGTALMLPVLVGIPGLLGLFRTAPITDFAGIAGFFGVEPTLALGVALFGAGGTVVLPLVFLVIGSFLPPKTPRAVRGVTFATCFWIGFVTAFWPGGSTATGALFLVLSLLGHWTYGLTLGAVLDRTTGIPQHEV